MTIAFKDLDFAGEWLERIEPLPRQVIVPDRKAVVPLDLPEGVRRAIDYLKNHAPEAVQDAGGDAATFKIGCNMWDCGISFDLALYLVSVLWNEVGKASPPWSPEDLATKIGNGYRYAKNQQGGALGRAQFDDTTEGEESAAKRRGPQITWSRDAGALALSNPIDPLIEGLLARQSLIVMYGTSNVGKTFVALDFAYHIAAGRPWQGRETTKGLVVYLAAEGGFGVLARGAALHKHYPHDAHLALVPYSLNLRDSPGDMAALLALIAEAEAIAGMKAQMVVIDTLSRALAGGDENGPVDMGAFVKNVDKIRGVTGAALLVIHHSGKDAARGARGHSLLRAATDTEIEVAENQIRVTKQRDMEAAKEVGFRLHEIEVGKDPKGRRVTSCVIEMVTGSEFVRLELDPPSQEMMDAFEFAAREQAAENGKSETEWVAETVSTERWDESFMSGFESEKSLSKGQKPTPPSYRQRDRLRTRVAQSGHVRKVKQGQWVAA